MEKKNNIIREYDSNGKVVYWESPIAKYWQKWKYNDKGQIIRREDSDGYWEVFRYDEQGKIKYCEKSNGFKIHKK